MSTQHQRCVARAREAIAEDPRTNNLDLDIRIRNGALVLWGPVDTAERGEAAETVALSVCTGMAVLNETWVADYGPVTTQEAGDRVRIASVGDVHVSCDAEGLLRLRLTNISEQADLLLLAGDLTQHGHAEEAEVLARDLEGLPLPVVAVLGNHDYHQDAEGPIRRILEGVGVHVLDGESIVLDLQGRRVGIAGVKGFGGGFAGACASEFGEPEMKDFIRHTKRQAEQLQALLAGLDADLRIALTHYSPVADTLRGEPREIYPFLGSYLLAEAIDASGCDLAIHGHAHKGVEQGVTAGGIPVRNVARPVIRDAYRVYLMSGEPRRVSRAQMAVPPGAAPAFT